MSKVFHKAVRQIFNAKVNVIFSDIGITLPSITNPGIQNFSSFKAIWDTGATNTVITEKIVNALSLMPTGKINCSGVHGNAVVNTYIVNIYLPNKVIIENVKVSEGKLLGAIDMLVGMDIIQLGDFSISNPNGKTVFSYCIPSHDNPVDLLEKSEKVNKRKS